jgi:hypothetical protein
VSSSEYDLSVERARAARLAGPDLAKCSPRELKSRSHAEFLKAFLASGLNQSELARRIGRSRQYVSDMVAGRRDIPDYVMRGLPREGRLAAGVGYLDSVEQEPPSVAGWR